MLESFLKHTYFLDVEFSEVGSPEFVWKLQNEQAFSLFLACSDFLSMQSHVLKGLLDCCISFPHQSQQNILSTLAIIVDPMLCIRYFTCGRQHISDWCNLKKGGSIWTHAFVAAKAWGWAWDGWLHGILSQKTEIWILVLSWLSLWPFFSILEPQPMGQYHSHSRWVFSSELNLSRNPLTDLPRGMSL